jgi:tetratricopeptide (TPR) repeat protein
VAHGVLESIQIANTNLASLYVRVGAFDDAIASVTASDDVAAPPDPSHATYRASLLCQAFALAARYDEALDAGRVALELGTGLGNARRLINVYERLAFAELGRGEWTSALGYLASAIALCNGTEDSRSGKSPLALTAFARMKLGKLKAARAAIDEMLRGEPYDAGVTEWPQRCDWIAAQVFRASGDPRRAKEFLERAHTRTLAERNALEEPYRSTFLALPWHREIVAAAERNEWPSV